MILLFKDTTHGSCNTFFKKLCGCGANVEAEEAASAEGYWLDLNVAETDSNEEEVEGVLKEILSPKKNEEIESVDQVTEMTDMDNISEGLLLLSMK